MPKFEGCIEAREISLCPVKSGGGANPHAHVLIRKNLGGSPDPKPEKTSMTDAEKAAQALEIQKAALKQTVAIAAMSEVTKAHFLGLAEDAQVAFLAKSAADQATEAEAAKVAADKAKMEEEAAKSGVTPQVLELQKSNATLTKQVEDLQKAQVEREIEKRADTEFSGFPGGSAKVIPLLKAYAKLGDEDRKASEDLLKAQCRLARSTMQVFAGRSEQELTAAAAAQTRMTEAVKAYAAEHKVTEAVALEKVSEKPEFADDVALING